MKQDMIECAIRAFVEVMPAEEKEKYYEDNSDKNGVEVCEDADKEEGEEDNSSDADRNSGSDCTETGEKVCDEAIESVTENE